ncbi:hypothetical protein GN956_G358 [Arapaima gigas]
MMDGQNISLSLNFAETYSEMYSGDNDTEYPDLGENLFICNSIYIPNGIKIAMCFLYVHIFLLAIPGNLIVGLVIVFTRQSLLLSDLYLFHLSVADVLLALTMPLWVTSVIWGWVFGDIMCKIVNLTMEVSFYSSILFLVCISIDRYQVIVHAMETRRENWHRWRWAMCCGVWAFGVILSIPALFSGTYQAQDSMKIRCMESSGQKHRVAIRILRQMLGFLVPLMIMLVCYGLTVARLLRTRGFKKQRAMRVIIAVVAAFLICWTPHHLWTMADTLVRARLVPFTCNTVQSLDLIMLATQTLALLHSCINPMLYAFLGEKFRGNVLQLFQRRARLEGSSLSRFSRSTSQTSDVATNFM